MLLLEGRPPVCPRLFFFNDPATTEISTLSLHDALPISHTWVDRHLVRRACAPANRSSLLYLEEELVRWNEERVLLKNAADDHGWVRPHDVHEHTCAKFGQIVRTDHPAVVLGKNLIQPCPLL